MKSEQVEGGSYDGPYHHAKEDVPTHINRILGKSDDVTHSDHDYLHKCGINEKLDGVGPLITDLSPNSSTTMTKKNLKK